MANEKAITDISKYLDLDKDDDRYEFYNGEVLKLPEHSTNHTLIEINVIEQLQKFLRAENALPFADNVRVFNNVKQAYTYPDLVVFHEQMKFDTGERLTVNNPCLIIEIIESTNPFYNQPERFELYQYLPGFQEYIIIDADSTHIICISDEGEQWQVQEALQMNEGVHSYAANCNFKMTDIYKDITINAGN